MRKPSRSTRAIAEKLPITSTKRMAFSLMPKQRTASGGSNRRSVMFEVREDRPDETVELKPSPHHQTPPETVPMMTVKTNPSSNRTALTATAFTNGLLHQGSR